VQFTLLASYYGVDTSYVATRFSQRVTILSPTMIRLSSPFPFVLAQYSLVVAELLSVSELSLG